MFQTISSAGNLRKHGSKRLRRTGGVNTGKRFHRKEEILEELHRIISMYVEEGQMRFHSGRIPA